MTGFEFLLLLAGILGGGQIYMAYKYFMNKPITEGNGSVPMLCYFALDPSWPDNGTLHPGLNATLCSHIIFIGADMMNGTISIRPSIASTYFSKIPLLRKQNPALKFLVTTGGGGELGFTLLLASKQNRTRFVSSIIPFMKKYDFDGLDLDFEFPGLGHLPHGQRKNFTILTQDLRQTFDQEAASGGRKYLLTAAVAAGRTVMIIYDVPALAKTLDYINLMCYDMYSYAPYDPITGFNSPLYPNTWQRHIPISKGNVGWSSYEWHRRGMPKSKIAVGIPTYTHTWTLEMPEKYHGPNSPATGVGYNDFAGYSWVCEFLRRPGTTKVWDEEAAVPYAYNGAEWISYDDVRSLTLKSEWIMKNGFGGIMVYSMNADDASGSCGEGKLPLLSAIRKTINSTTLY